MLFEIKLLVVQFLSLWSLNRFGKAVLFPLGLLLLKITCDLYLALKEIHCCSSIHWKWGQVQTAFTPTQSEGVHALLFDTWQLFWNHCHLKSWMRTSIISTAYQFHSVAGSLDDKSSASIVFIFLICILYWCLSIITDTNGVFQKVRSMCSLELMQYIQ